MVPMVMGAMLSTVTAGNLISKTGQYKGILLACPAIATVGLLLLSTLQVNTSIWMISLFLFVFGVGIGLGVQNLVLVVQSAFPVREVGTATAATNFFREIGASLGAAAVGSVFTSRLVSLLAERVPDGATTSVDVASLTPQVLRSLPDALRLPIAGAYNDALVPVFLLLIPMMLIGLVLLLFVQEVPLAGNLETAEAGSQGPDDPPFTSVEGLPAA
jgi:MFS family permease